MDKSQLRELIVEGILNELLVQKLKSLSIGALKTLIKAYTQYKDPNVLVANLEDTDKIKERLIFILNNEVSDETRAKMEKEMSAWRWGWTRSANRQKSDDALTGKNNNKKKKDRG